MRAIALLVLVAVAATAAAQEPDRALGPWLDAHYMYAGGASVSGAIPFEPYQFTTSSGSGGGATIGYGILPWLSAYATLGAAGGQQVTAAAPAMNGTLTLHQADAGVRAQWALHSLHLTPYALVAYSSRLLTGPVTGTPQGDGTYSTWGSAVTYGAGFEFFFAQAFSVDASYQRSTGTYGRLTTTSGAVFTTGASSTSTSRALAGVTWHAGELRTGAAPVTNGATPLEVGQELRVQVGPHTVAGKVALIGRDTIILQRFVKDQPVQIVVPMQCIGAIHRRRPPQAIEPELFGGSVIGAIAGGLVGAVLNGQSSKTAKSTGGFAALYLLPGAVLGAGVGAAINVTRSRWEPVPPPKGTALSYDQRNALCTAWVPPA